MKHATANWRFMYVLRWNEYQRTSASRAMKLPITRPKRPLNRAAARWSPDPAQPTKQTWKHGLEASSWTNRSANLSDRATLVRGTDTGEPSKTMELGRFANVSMTGMEILVLVQAMTVKLSRSCIGLLASEPRIQELLIWTRLGFS